MIDITAHSARLAACLNTRSMHKRNNLNPIQRMNCAWSFFLSSTPNSYLLPRLKEDLWRQNGFSHFRICKWLFGDWSYIQNFLFQTRCILVKGYTQVGLHNRTKAAVESEIRIRDRRDLFRGGVGQGERTRGGE